MNYTDFLVGRAQHMRPLEYDLSGNFNELVRYLHDMGMLDNVPVGTLGPAEILTASDALAAPLRSLVVGGNSTQDGTPTPDAPIPILSAANPVLHVSDGTTDTTVTLPVTLRSLPDGTRDTLELTYLRPSSREGWAWYAGELTQNVVYDDRPTISSLGTASSGYQYCAIYVDSILGATKLCTHARNGAYASEAGICYITNRGKFLCLSFEAGTFASVSDVQAWVDANSVSIQYQLATPVTTTLDPIELPVLPAPSVTIYATADATPTLTAQYVRDISAAINDMQEAIADI